MHHDRLMHLAAKALASGGQQVSPTTVEWDLSRGCASPRRVACYARPAGRRYMLPGRRWSPEGGVMPGEFQERFITVERGTKGPLEVELQVQCRRCDRCRRGRAALWRSRARAEISTAARTWFGTLTLAPASQYEYLARARQSVARQGLDFDALPLDEQFRLRCNAINEELTKYIKRLRKNSGAQLRVLLVAEYHKSGDPHYHILIHEVDPDRQVSYRQLSGAWRLGFVKFNLVTDAAAAGYICKYLSKNLAARVRASQGYGQDTTSSHSDVQTKRETLTSPSTPLAPSMQGLSVDKTCESVSACELQERGSNLDAGDVASCLPQGLGGIPRHSTGISAAAETRPSPAGRPEAAAWAAAAPRQTRPRFAASDARPTKEPFGSVAALAACWASHSGGCRCNHRTLDSS